MCLISCSRLKTDLHRLEAQIHAVKQKKVELLQEALHGFQALSEQEQLAIGKLPADGLRLLEKRHAAENQLVHQRLQELRERTREEASRQDAVWAAKAETYIGTIAFAASPRLQGEPSPISAAGEDPPARLTQGGDPAHTCASCAACILPCPTVPGRTAPCIAIILGYEAQCLPR